MSMILVVGVAAIGMTDRGAYRRFYVRGRSGVQLLLFIDMFFPDTFFHKENDGSE
jgi:hypothetical protein